MTMPSATSLAWTETSERVSLWKRWTRGFRKLGARADWVELLGPDWAERVMGLEASDRFHAKQGRSIGRLTLEEETRRLVVYLKRHYVLPRRHGLLATLFPRGAWSPGWQELGNLQQARALGLPVPEVAAAGEFVGPHGRLSSFLAVEELADMLPLHEAIPLGRQLLPDERFTRWKAGLAAEMARLTRQLHDARWFHKDLYLCHFFVDPAPRDHTDRGLALIDFHRLARHRVGAPYYRWKDLGQLLFSSIGVEGITERDRLRFWMHYRRALGLGTARAERWIIRARAARYLAHQASTHEGPKAGARSARR